MKRQPMTHEAFIHAVRMAAAASASLTDEERKRILSAKLTYGIGERGLRGVTHYGQWLVNGCKDCPSVDFAEVCAKGEESPVQLAGTTIHELGHILTGMGHGHNKAWKEACERLGLRHVMAAGTRYLLANFQPRIREVIAGMGEPEDGKPAFLDGSAARGKPGVCTAGVGVRGGKSRGIGSGSRMLKVFCPTEGGCDVEGKPYTLRASAYWLNLKVPTCPVHGVPMVRG